MSFINEHPAVVAIVSYWLFSAIVGGMPAPTETSSPGYRWLHDSLHILAGNISAAVATKYPNLPGGTTVHTDTLQQTTIQTPKVK